MIFPSWQRLVRLYEQELSSLMGTPPTVERLYAISNSRKFQESAWRVAEHMVNGVAKANAASWREAAMKNSRARQIYESLRKELLSGPGHAVRRIVAQNASLIRSLPLDLAEKTTAYVAREQQKGRRASEIEKELRQRLPELTKSKVRLIARTEVSKSETALTRARSEEIGIKFYVWETSRDSRVRPSHRNMNSVIVSWNSPPAPEALIGQKSTLGHYHAGSCPQCRCVALPLISLDEIAFPARAYLNGSIRRISRAEFTRAVGVPLAA